MDLMFLRGFSWSMDLMFLRGLVLTTACTIFLTGALVTFLIASLFSKTERSVLAILGGGKFHPALVVLALRQVPYRPSSFLKADSVQMQNLPTWPPGASFNKFRLSTCITSTPGMFLKATWEGFASGLSLLSRSSTVCTAPGARPAPLRQGGTCLSPRWPTLTSPSC